MDLDQLANLGEFVGGVAVLVTLVYLAVQVRQGNALERRNGDRAFVEQVDRAFFEPMRDPERMLMLQRAARSFDGLEHHEKAIVNAIWAPMMVVTQELWQLRREGAEGAYFSAMSLFATSFLQMPGAAQWWRDVKGFLPPPFVRYIDEVLQSPERPPALHDSIAW